MTHTPPRIAQWLFRATAHPADCAVMLDDLAEEYGERIRREATGTRSAGRWYWRQVLSSLGPNLARRYRRRPPPRRREPMFRFWHDIRYAIRSLARKPVFSAVAILSLSMGIGVTTLVYTVVDAAVLHPFPEAMDRLVAVGSAFPQADRPDVDYIEVHSAPEFADVRESVTTLEHVVAFDLGNRHIMAGDRPERVFTAFWWGDVFPALGIDPALGRGFSQEEIRGGERVAVISYRLWLNFFGGDRAVLGRTLSVTGRPYVIVGVAAPDAMLVGTDLWVPMWTTPETMPRGRRQFQILGRLKDGASLTEVNAELAALAGRIEQEYVAEHEEYAGWRLEADNWTGVNVAAYRPAGAILLVAVGLVVLLVCANVANLILGRSEARRQELAVRRALGAGRGRILQQLMTENTILALTGGALGIAGALAIIKFVAGELPQGMIPAGTLVAVNGRILLMASVVTLATTLVFGLVPALQAARPDLRAILHSDAAGGTSSGASHRLHRAFVTAEVALAVVLLAGAGLLINSFVRLQRVDPGYDAGRALTMRITLPRDDYPGPAITAFFETVQERVAALPGVSQVAVSSQLPPGVFSRRRFAVEGLEHSTGDIMPSAFLTIGSDNYQETMGTPMLSGRPFNSRDQLGSPPVAIINEAAARRFFGDADPVGRRIKPDPDEDYPWVEVVGVVANTRNRGLDAEPAPEVFANMRQVEGWWNQLFLVIRTEGDPTGMLPAVRETIAGIDATLPLYYIRTLDGAIANSIAQRRLATGALTVFAIAALLLAAIGIYGVVSYAVNRRTREIGVRMALGAARSQVTRQVIRQAMIPVGLGLAIGIPAAAVLSSLLTDVMYQVTPGDPLTIGIMAGVLAAVALVASYLPARRASRLDPVMALRYE